MVIISSYDISPLPLCLGLSVSVSVISSRLSLSLSLSRLSLSLSSVNPWTSFISCQLYRYRFTTLVVVIITRVSLTLSHHRL